MDTSGWIVLGVIVALGAIAVFVIVGIYNSLVQRRNRFKNAFSQIDVQMKRRHDLIPNLVETAKGYMKHENETLEAVIQARNQAVQVQDQAARDPTDAGTMRKLAAAESSLGGTLGRLFALSENYPDLKADRQMSELMEELTSTENKIAFARQAYNDSVMHYNTAREVFPAVLFATSLGFQPAELLEFEDESKDTPEVSF